MRRSLSGPFGLTVLAGFLALLPAAGAIAEDTVFEKVSSDGSQIVPAGVAAAMKSATKNLNTVPDDGLGPDVAKGPNSRLVRQLLAARPNEDLIICIAGCFSGHDRIVYAQPIERPMTVKKAGPTSDLNLPGSGQQNISAVQPGDGARSAATPASVAPSSVAHSNDPRAPAILNRGSAATVGSSSDQDAAAGQPSQAPVAGGATN
jgi:hypothetical protein